MALDASFLHRLLRQVSRSRVQQILFAGALFLLLMAPSGILMLHNFRSDNAELTRDIYAQRKKLADIQVRLMAHQFRHLKEIGISLATRVRFRQLLQEEKWDDAIKIMESVPTNFPTVERVMLMDLQGTMRADTVSASDVLGESFAFREYYQGLMERWEPHLGEVITAKAAPYHNSAIIAVPIASVDRERLGILILQVRLNTIQEWIGHMRIGTEGITYIVDQAGQLVAHPDQPPDGEIIDLSLLPVVGRVTQGESGIDILRNPLEGDDRLVVYRPIADTGWGMIIAQPVREAFAFRNELLRRSLIFGGIILTVNAIVVWLILLFIFKLHAARSKEESILENIGDAVIAIDRYFTITHFNAAAEHLSGINSDDAIGKPFRDVVHLVRSRDRREDISFVEQVMIYGEKRTMPDGMLLLREDGTEVHVADAAAPLFDSSGKHVIGANIIMRDVQREKDLEENRRNLLSMVAHEIRTPPTAIRWGLTALKKELPDLSPKGTEALSAIEGANEVLLQLGSELINVFRVNFHDISIHPEPTDLPHLVDETLELFTGKIEENHLSLHKDYSDITMETVDPKVVKLLLQNFVSNAVKYTPEGGSVTVTMEREKDTGRIVFSVCDTGPGIPQEQQEKLFSQFFRASNTKHIEGVGLGLYICKQMSEKCGCELWFESTEGEGTTFFFAIPKAGMTAVEGEKELA